MDMIAPRSEPEPAFIEQNGERIAVRHRAARPGRPTVLFLPGYGSDMAGIKALAIDAHCAELGLGCLRLDYSGTGLSSGTFEQGTLDRWLDEVLAVLDLVAATRLLIVGASMGGWIALHAALRRPGQIAAMLGIAAAPDFTAWGFATVEEKAVLERESRLERMRPDGSIMLRTLRFWKSGAPLELLGGPIDLPIPIRLVHGTADEAVPTAIALRLFEQLRSPDLQLRLIKDARHNLSDPPELAAILAEIETLVDRID
jgi:pimeloyl-ACP methyl ester carboxylesterase